VTNGDSTTVSVIDTATNTLITTIPVGPAPERIDITPDGAFAYVVADPFLDVVSVIDIATNAVIATISLSDPLAVAITPDGAFAYVTNVLSNTVTVIDTATNTVITSIPVGDGPFAIAFAQVDRIGSLIARVQALVAGGSLRQNQAAGLIAKLEQIRSKIDNGQTRAANNQLGAFINQVKAFVNNGSLTASQGQALIDAANAIRLGLE